MKSNDETLLIPCDDIPAGFEKRMAENYERVNAPRGMSLLDVVALILCAGLILMVAFMIAMVITF